MFILIVSDQWGRYKQQVPNLAELLKEQGQSLDPDRNGAVNTTATPLRISKAAHSIAVSQ